MEEQANTNMNTPKKVYFETLGCKTNQYESEALAALFAEAGYDYTEDIDEADVCVVNTCTVTHVSDRKSRQVIRRVAGAKKKDAVLVVCGCYAQVAMEDVAALGEADVIVGTNQRSHIVKAVEDFLASNKRKTYVATTKEMADFEPLGAHRVINMTRAYLKIQEGCQQYCSYCIIPYARGPLRSRKMADILAEVRNLEEANFQELILTGTHIGAYGVEDGNEGYDLADVCAQILANSSIPRLRLGSIEPTEVTDKLLQLMVENPRMCRQLHMPLQSGSDEVLKRMKRPYKTDDYRKIVKKAREMVPEVAITTDIMVGFPGESNDDFRESLMFADEIAFAAMHIFKYSPRENTPAAAMSDQVDSTLKDKRSKAMAAVAEKNELKYMERFVGAEVEVLLEEVDKKGYWEGHTDNYLKILCRLDDAVKGQMRRVKITELNKRSLYGEEV